MFSCQINGVNIIHPKTSTYSWMSFESFMILASKIYAGDGTGGESIFGLNFQLIHERKGILSMANSGPNANASYFFITNTRTSHLDGKHVVFGEVMKEIGDVCSIEHVPTNDHECSTLNIIIADCGEIPHDDDYGSSNFFKYGDIFNEWPADLDVLSNYLSWWTHVVHPVKSLGNEHSW